MFFVLVLVGKMASSAFVFVESLLDWYGFVDMWLVWL